MALEYRLQIKSKMSLFNCIENYLNEKNILFSKENINNVMNLYLYEVLGFMISLLQTDKVFFEYLINENETIEDNWNYSTNIHFRLDKFYDNLLGRSNMIDMCIYVLNNTKDDAKLLFNGDILVLERNNGIVNINKNFGFWNSKDLINKTSSL